MFQLNPNKVELLPLDSFRLTAFQKLYVDECTAIKPVVAPSKQVNSKLWKSKLKESAHFNEHIENKEEQWMLQKDSVLFLNVKLHQFRHLLHLIK